MGIAAYRRGSALISRQFARDAYRRGESSYDPDAVQAKPTPRPADWGSKADLRALDHAQRVVAGARRYGLPLDREVLVAAVMDRANVKQPRAERAVDLVLG